MALRKYFDHDYLPMCDWFIKRNLKPPTPVLLPKNGIIVQDVAAGFLILTDSNVGMLDFFITNPDQPKDVRLDALDNIAKVLTHTAQNLKLMSLICNTTFINIKELAQRQGFTYLGEYSTFAKEI